MASPCWAKPGRGLRVKGGARTDRARGSRGDAAIGRYERRNRKRAGPRANATAGFRRKIWRAAAATLPAHEAEPRLPGRLRGLLTRGRSLVQLGRKLLKLLHLLVQQVVELLVHDAQL